MAIFAIGTVRSINLGVLAIVMTFVLGTAFAGESAGAMVSGFPIELFILLAGVAYLFGVAALNGTVERIVDGAAYLVRGRRRLIPPPSSTRRTRASESWPRRGRSSMAAWSGAKI